MKIKSIKPTNKYKEIEFNQIIEDPVDKYVYTPSGFQPVLACEKIKKGPTLKITTSDGEVVCDPHHRFLVNRTETKFARDLMPADRLVGYGDKELEFTATEGPVSDLYDIQLPDPHWWYTSGVVSHNSILLVNNAISSLKGIDKNGQPGQNVLLVTFELDTIKTALRCMASVTGIPTDSIGEHKDHIGRVFNQLSSTYGKDILIYELPPEECSVNHIYTIIDHNRRKTGWVPDVIILDYLDLMMSRNNSFNEGGDYNRLKHVATEIRGLAKNTDTLVFTATQTNRSGAEDGQVIDITKTADSFGKQFALDYVVSLNQSRQDRIADPPRLSMYIAKNRNGPKSVLIDCEINYDTMSVREVF